MVRAQHKITVGAYLASAGDWIGRAFVSVEFPDGKVVTRGFWPKNGFDLRRKSDRKSVLSGMEGVILDDSDYLIVERSGLKKTCTYVITESQAKAAMEVIERYEKDPPEYAILTNQCATFSVDVLKAAGIELPAGIPPSPRAIYVTLGGKLPRQ